MLAPHFAGVGGGKINKFRNVPKKSPQGRSLEDVHNLLVAGFLHPSFPEVCARESQIEYTSIHKDIYC